MEYYSTILSNKCNDKGRNIKKEVCVMTPFWEAVSLYVGLAAGVAMIFIIVIVMKNKNDDMDTEE